MVMLLNEVIDALLEVGTCSGLVCMERLLNEGTNGLLEFGTCSGHVYMERLSITWLIVYSMLELAQAIYL